MISNLTANFANLMSNGVNASCSEIRKICSRNIRPKIFNRIKFRRIRRKPLICKPTILFHNIPLCAVTPMRWQPVPKQYYLFPEMLTQAADKYLNLGASYAPRQEPQKKSNFFSVSIRCQNCYSREVFPCKGSNYNGSYSFGRPSSSDRGLFGKTTFIKKCQNRTYSSGFFFIRGHLYLSQLRVAFSSFSFARLTGLWQLQPIEPSSFQICPGWYST